MNQYCRCVQTSALRPNYRIMISSEVMKLWKTLETHLRLILLLDMILVYLIQHYWLNG